jgi:hypothetical protein
MFAGEQTAGWGLGIVAITRHRAVSIAFRVGVSMAEPAKR